MKVTVADIIEYLQTNCKPETRVHLDKDGRMDDEINVATVQELIRYRGIFYLMNEDTLFINN
jgi:hypothetical protein